MSSHRVYYQHKVPQSDIYALICCPKISLITDSGQTDWGLNLLAGQKCWPKAWFLRFFASRYVTILFEIQGAGRAGIIKFPLQNAVLVTSTPCPKEKKHMPRGHCYRSSIAALFQFSLITDSDLFCHKIANKFHEGGPVYIWTYDDWLRALSAARARHAL